MDLPDQSEHMESGGSVPKEGDKLALTLAKGASVSFVGRIWERALLLIGQIFLARALGASNYGLFSLGWSVLQVSLDTTALGLPQGIIHFGTIALNKGSEAFRRVLQQTIFLAASIGVAAGCSLFLLSPHIAALFGDPRLVNILRGIGVVLALTVILKVVASATRISNRMQFGILAEDFIPSLLIALGGVILMLARNRTVTSAIAILIAAYSISTLTVVWFIFGLYRDFFQPVKWQSPLFKEMMSFSLPASVAGILSVLLQWITRLILGYLRPDAELGIYQAVSQLSSLPTIVLGSFGAIFLPMISRLIHSGKNDELRELYKIATKWSVYLVCPLFLVLVTFPSSSLELLFGKVYAQGALALIIMTSGQLINLATGSVAPLHIMQGYQKRWSFILLISLLVTIVLNWWWIPTWGLTGAALGNAAGISIANIWGVFSLKQLRNLWPYDKRYWKGLFSAVLTLPVLLLFGRLFPSGLIALVGASILSTVLFSAMIFYAGLDHEDRQFFAAFRKRLSFVNKA